MSYEELDDATYTELRKRILRKKGSDDQMSFLDALRSSSKFSGWIRERVKIEQGESFPILEERLTESEFKEPPKKAEKWIFDTWKSISPANAARVTFWGFMTLRHIEEGKIESFYLAANGGAQTGGRERIDRTQREGNDRDIDSIARTALRRMSGLPEARGNRSVYVNCPFARAWWRRHIAQEVRDQSDAEMVDILKVLTVSPSYWEGLISLVVSRNSVLGDAKVRTALIWALADFINDEDTNDLFHGKVLRRIQRLIGIRSALQELGVFSVKELKEMIKDQFIPAAQPQK